MHPDSQPPVEGLALLDLLASVRFDVKVLANYMLTQIPQLQKRIIGVDPFGGETAARTNLSPLRQALNWLKQDGLMVIFPVGEVASWRPPEHEPLAKVLA